MDATIPVDINKKLSELAMLTGKTTDFYIEAIIKYLEELEDIYIAEKRLEDVRSGRSKTVPLEEVMKRHGLES